MTRRLLPALLALLALALCGCRPGPSPAPEGAVSPVSPAPAPPPDEGAAAEDTEAAAAASRLERCQGYCEAVARCQPEHHYPDCPGDCVRLLSDSQASAVSGITPALVRCWSEAATCEQAARCDGGR